jgi:trehalose synthase
VSGGEWVEESARLSEVEVRPLRPGRLERFIGADRTERFEEIAARARALFAGRRVVNVNSTAAGGGVAELLQTLLAYARGSGIDTRWLVIDGDAKFFEITKRLHNNLYGGPGDGGQLSSRERSHYDATLARNAPALSSFLRAGDVVILHDPQTAGLAPLLRRRGLQVVWRCHIGIDTQNEFSDLGWEFLRRYFDEVAAYVFSRQTFAPSWIPRERLRVIMPSIDPFSAKNEPMGPSSVTRSLVQVGLVSGRDGSPMRFVRRDGTRGLVSRRVDMLGTTPLPNTAVPVVLQASRWDPMKDMWGVMQSFTELVAPGTDTHLVLAGPEVHGVADDPEAKLVLVGCRDAWGHLTSVMRARVHLACVPMSDVDESAFIVNALQRHATVVAQKSLAEGFGLTITEAMWKARPVVASDVGGIVDQVVPGVTGALVDPADLEAFAHAVRAIVDDSDLATRMGQAGRERVVAEFLGDRHLKQWAELFENLS